MNRIVLNLTPVLSSLLNSIKSAVNFFRTTDIVVFGFTFTLWDAVISAMVFAASLAAIIPKIDAFDADETSEFFDDGYFDREHFYDED